MLRIAVYIDIEGFSTTYRESEQLGLESLRRLMMGVYEVWSRFLGKPADRLFAHQFGDGFLVLQDDWSPTIDRGVAVAIGLMRYLLAWGFVGRSGIATGDFSDISSLERAVRAEANARFQRSAPDGVMTTAHVMGDALISAYKIQENDLSGPLLFVLPKLLERISGQELVLQHSDQDHSSIAIDWVRSRVPQLDDVLRILRVEMFNPDMLSKLLRGYVSAHPRLSAEWRRNADLLVTGKCATLKSKHQVSSRIWPFAAGLVLGLAIRRPFAGRHGRNS